MKNIRKLNKFFCHRRADRSFYYKGKQFPVCARCTGVFVGEIASIIVYPIFKLGYKISLLFCLVMFTDWFIQHIKLKESTNFRRFITGIMAGYGLTFIEIDLIINISILLWKGELF